MRIIKESENNLLDVTNYIYNQLKKNNIKCEEPSKGMGETTIWFSPFSPRTKREYNIYQMRLILGGYNKKEEASIISLQVYINDFGWVGLLTDEWKTELDINNKSKIDDFIDFMINDSVNIIKEKIIPAFNDKRDKNKQKELAKLKNQTKRGITITADHKREVINLSRDLYKNLKDIIDESYDEIINRVKIDSVLFMQGRKGNYYDQIDIAIDHDGSLKEYESEFGYDITNLADEYSLDVQEYKVGTQDAIVSLISYYNYQ